MKTLQIAAEIVEQTVALNLNLSKFTGEIEMSRVERRISIHRNAIKLDKRCISWDVGKRFSQDKTTYIWLFCI